MFVITVAEYRNDKVWLLKMVVVVKKRHGVEYSVKQATLRVMEKV